MSRTLRFWAVLVFLLLPQELCAVRLDPIPGTSGTLKDFLFSFSDSLMGVFGAVVFLFLFFYAASMIIFSMQDNAMTEAKNSFLYAIIGMVVASVAVVIAGAVIPGTGTLVNTTQLEGPITNIFAFCLWAAGIAFLANVVVQGLRLVASEGEQEYIDRAKKRLITSVIGVGIVVLTKFIVDAALNLNMGLLSVEVSGIASFAVSLIGIAAVVAIIIGGVLLVVSVDESFKEKAKTMIKTALIAVLAAALSYVIVKTFTEFGAK